MTRRIWELLRRLELQTLLTLVGAGAAVWAFLAVLDEVGEGDTAAVDRQIILFFRTPGDPTDPIGPRVFEEAMRDVTALGGFTFLTLFTVVAVASLAFYGKRRQAVVLAATVLAAQVTNDLLKAVIGRDRPDLVPHASYVYSHSFPSGHSALSAATFLTVAAILSSLERKRRAKAFVFALAILLTVGIGLSRIYLGVHWPSDVVGGWTLGAAWALIARVVLIAWRGPGPAETRRSGPA